MQGAAVDAAAPFLFSVDRSGVFFGAAEGE
jgi:hypothetical protein